MTNEGPTRDPMRMPRPTVAIDPDSPVWEALIKGIEEFNSWRFYDCHETLEDVWREAGGKNEYALAPLYQGVIKVAAGLHHLLRNNYKGTVNLLSDSVRLLDPYRPLALGIDIERLVGDVREVLRIVEELGPQRLQEFDRARIPTIAFDPVGQGRSE